MSSAEQIADLRTALSACKKEPYNARRRQEVFDRISTLTDVMRGDGWTVDEMTALLHEILRAVPNSGVDEDQAVQHAIVQYFR
jgi:hypothetical protein